MNFINLLALLLIWRGLWTYWPPTVSVGFILRMFLRLQKTDLVLILLFRFSSRSIGYNLFFGLVSHLSVWTKVQTKVCFCTYLVWWVLVSHGNYANRLTDFMWQNYVISTSSTWVASFCTLHWLVCWQSGIWCLQVENCFVACLLATVFFLSGGVAHKSCGIFSLTSSLEST